MSDSVDYVIFYFVTIPSMYRYKSYVVKIWKRSCYGLKYLHKVLMSRWARFCCHVPTSFQNNLWFAATKLAVDVLTSRQKYLFFCCRKVGFIYPEFSSKVLKSFTCHQNSRSLLPQSWLDTSDNENIFSVATNITVKIPSSHQKCQLLAKNIQCVRPQTWLENRKSPP